MQIVFNTESKYLNSLRWLNTIQCLSNYKKLFDVHKLHDNYCKNNPTYVFNSIFLNTNCSAPESLAFGKMSIEVKRNRNNFKYFSLYNTLIFFQFF